MAMTTRKKSDLLSRIYDNQMKRQERMMRQGKFKGAGGSDKYAGEIVKAAKVRYKWAQEEAKNFMQIGNRLANLKRRK